MIIKKENILQKNIGIKDMNQMKTHMIGIFHSLLIHFIGQWIIKHLNNLKLRDL